MWRPKECELGGIMKTAESVHLNANHVSPIPRTRHSMFPCFKDFTRFSQRRKSFLCGCNFFGSFLFSNVDGVFLGLRVIVRDRRLRVPHRHKCIQPNIFATMQFLPVFECVALYWTGHCEGEPFHKKAETRGSVRITGSASYGALSVLNVACTSSSSSSLLQLGCTRQ